MTDATAVPAPAEDPVAKAITMLELLAPPAREAVLARMDPDVAGRIRSRMETSPERSTKHPDIVQQRRALRELADRVQQGRIETADRAAAQLDAAIAPDASAATMPGGAPGTGPGHGAGDQRPMEFARAAAQGGRGERAGAAATIVPTTAAPVDPLDQLRSVHPAAIARAMQGERAEAWAIVLDRIDVSSRAALQLYLDPAARRAIDDARARQAQLREHAPALVRTVEDAIARTVVPRAVRDHHLLLSTTSMMHHHAV